MVKKMGMKVNAFFFASDHAGIIEGMRFNKVQVAWFGKQPPCRPRPRRGVFAQMVNADGSPRQPILLDRAHKDSP
jgi:phosphonate transport system substrate-binding protein